MARLEELQRYVERTFRHVAESKDVHFTIQLDPRLPKSMFTDPKKIRANDKGDPSGCSVFNTHKLYTPEWGEIEKQCRSGTIGCVACKTRLIETLNKGLEPIREARVQWVSRMDDVKEILVEGSKSACRVAETTMKEIRAAVKLNLPEKGNQP